MRSATSGVTDARSPERSAWILLFETPAWLANSRMVMGLPVGAHCINPRRRARSVSQSRAWVMGASVVLPTNVDNLSRAHRACGVHERGQWTVRNGGELSLGAARGRGQCCSACA